MPSSPSLGKAPFRHLSVSIKWPHKLTRLLVEIAMSSHSQLPGMRSHLSRTAKPSSAAHMLRLAWNKNNKTRRHSSHALSVLHLRDRALIQFLHTRHACGTCACRDRCVHVCVCWGACAMCNYRVCVCVSMYMHDEPIHMWCRIFNVSPV